MKLFFIIYFIINIFNIIPGEYFIKKIPSYLYKKFDNIPYEIFPSDIRINISLTHIDGDLLYSFDKNYNQLIVTIIEIMGAAIKIKFRNIEYISSINKLCGCEKCLYKILVFRIQIREEIIVQCNDGEFKKFTYEKNKEINEEYPLLYSKNDTNNGLPNEAHMWIVNQERYKDIYDNPRQLFGCIFNVWYDRKEINFTRISDNVGRKCRAVCIGDICNGGKCYETYNGVPVCDCTKAFLTGTYCNDSITSMNIRSSESYYFPLLKVSWKSSSKEILLIKNSNIQLQLHLVEKILFLKYTYMNGSYEGTLSRSYIPNREYTLIIYFMKTVIDIQFFNNGSLFHTIIPTNIDLSNEVFTSLLLQSEDGYIGLYYKDSPEKYTWSKVDILQSENVAYGIKLLEQNIQQQQKQLKQQLKLQQQYEKDRMLSEQTIQQLKKQLQQQLEQQLLENDKVKKNMSIHHNVNKFQEKDIMSKGVIVSIVIPTVISVILSVILIFVYFRVKKQRRRRRNRKSTEQEELLIQLPQQEEDEKRKALEQQLLLIQQQEYDEKRKALEQQLILIQQQQQECDERRKAFEQQVLLIQLPQQDERKKAEEQQELLLQLPQQQQDEKVKEYVLWVAARGGYIPPRAIDAGGGCFVARALCEGILIPGSIRKGSKCCVPYGIVDKINDYEVLVESETAESNSVEWHFAKGRDIPQCAIIAGRDYREPLYIARCKVEEETVVGKYSSFLGYGHIPYRGDVLKKDDLEVLCYRPQNI